MNAIKAPRSALLVGSCVSALLLLGVPAVAQAAAPTFEQVMAAPDDPQLNLDYAQDRAAAGDLLEAAAALERVLAVHPEWDRARLFYVSVLYRLDDRQGAGRQLAALNSANLTPVQRDEAEEYRRLIDNGPASARFGGEVSVGYISQSDAGGALAVMFDHGTGVTRMRGSSRVLSGELHGSVPLGSGGLSGIGSVAVEDSSSLTGPDDDYRVIVGALGVSKGDRNTGWSIAAAARDIHIQDFHYITEWGVQAGAHRRIGENTLASVSLSAMHQDYEEPNTDLSTGVSSHDGWDYDLGAALTHRLNRRVSVTLSGGLESKSAGYKPFAYRGEHLALSIDHTFSRGLYASLGGSLRKVDYREADPLFLAGSKRKDTISDLHLVVGAPFSAVLGSGGWRDHLILEASVNQIRRDTVLPLADYDSTNGQVRLVWRFGAR